MIWQAITEAEIQDLIIAAEAELDTRQKHVWDRIKITPQKWQQNPWGDEGGGFWAVALSGQSVVWYNDIEEGFNISTYSVPGYIEDYGCNQDGLALVVRLWVHRWEQGA